MTFFHLSSFFSDGFFKNFDLSDDKQSTRYTPNCVTSFKIFSKFLISEMPNEIFGKLISLIFTSPVKKISQVFLLIKEIDASRNCPFELNTSILSPSRFFITKRW